MSDNFSDRVARFRLKTSGLIIGAALVVGCTGGETGSSATTSSEAQSTSSLSMQSSSTAASSQDNNSNSCASDIAAGAALYQSKTCIACHGAVPDDGTSIWSGAAASIDLFDDEGDGYATGPHNTYELPLPEFIQKYMPPGGNLTQQEANQLTTYLTHTISGDDGWCAGNAWPPGNTDANNSSEQNSSAPAAMTFAPPKAQLRRLSSTEYRNTIFDILGVEPQGVDELGLDDSLGGFVSLGSRRLGFSAAAIEKLEEISYSVARAALMDDLSLRGQLLSCTPMQSSDNCVQSFVSNYQRLLYRRPPTNQERERVMGVIEDIAGVSDIWTGMVYGLAAMLQSPNFLFRVELGVADEQQPWLRYDGYERATRLAFLLTGSSPDETLLDAAQAGELDTKEGVLTQAQRLMQSTRFEETLSSFFNEQLHLNDIGTMVKDPALIAQGLPSAMQKEIELMVRDWVWTQQRPISELFLSQKTFVNSDLADFYGLEATPGDDFTIRYRDADDPRVGLLGAAGLLAVNSGFTETSATMRGRYIMQQLLCEEIPEPPPGVDVSLDPLPEGVVLTMRERVALHLTEEVCAACHRAMDPVGLPLENFDAVGRYRETDHGLAIDASGSLGGVEFEGLRGLSNTLANDPRVDACMVQRFYSYALGHELEPSDRTAVTQLQSEYNGNFTDLISKLVQHEAFLFATGFVPPSVTLSPSIEAEDFDEQSPASPFAVEQDADRTVIVWPGQGGNNSTPSDDAEGQLFYNIVAEGAALTLFGTVNFAGGENDSFYFKLEGVSDWQQINNTSTTGYEELLFGSWNNLTDGQTYILKIQRREDGAKLDALRLEGGNFTQ